MTGKQLLEINSSGGENLPSMHPGNKCLVFQNIPVVVAFFFFLRKKACNGNNCPITTDI